MSSIDELLQVIDTASNVSEKKTALEKLIELVTSRIQDGKEPIGPQCRHVARTLTAVMGEHDLATFQSIANGDASLGPSMFPQVVDTLGLMMISPADRWLHRAFAVKVIPTLIDDLPKLAPLEQIEERVQAVLAVLIVGICFGSSSNTADAADLFAYGGGEASSSSSTNCKDAITRLIEEGKLPGLPNNLSKMIPTIKANVGKEAGLGQDETKFCYDGLASVMSISLRAGATATAISSIGKALGLDKENIEKQISFVNSFSKKYHRSNPGARGAFSSILIMDVVENLKNAFGVKPDEEADESPSAATSISSSGDQIARLEGAIKILKTSLGVSDPVAEYESVRNLLLEPLKTEIGNSNSSSSSLTAALEFTRKNLCSRSVARTGKSGLRLVPLLSKIIAKTHEAAFTTGDEGSLSSLRTCAELADRIPWACFPKDQPANDNDQDSCQKSMAATFQLLNEVVAILSEHLSFLTLESENADGKLPNVLSAAEPLLHIVQTLYNLKVPVWLKAAGSAAAAVEAEKEATLVKCATTDVVLVERDETAEGEAVQKKEEGDAAPTTETAVSATQQKKGSTRLVTSSPIVARMLEVLAAIRNPKTVAEGDEAAAPTTTTVSVGEIPEEGVDCFSRENLAWLEGVEGLLSALEKLDRRSRDTMRDVANELKKRRGEKLGAAKKEDKKAPTQNKAPSPAGDEPKTPPSEDLPEDEIVAPPPVALEEKPVETLKESNEELSTKSDAAADLLKVLVEIENLVYDICQLQKKERKGGNSSSSTAGKFSWRPKQQESASNNQGYNDRRIGQKDHQGGLHRRSSSNFGGGNRNSRDDRSAPNLRRHDSRGGYDDRRGGGGGSFNNRQYSRRRR